MDTHDLFLRLNFFFKLRFSVVTSLLPLFFSYIDICSTAFCLIVNITQKKNVHRLGCLIQTHREGDKNGDKEIERKEKKKTTKKKQKSERIFCVCWFSPMDVYVHELTFVNCTKWHKHNDIPFDNSVIYRRKSLIIPKMESTTVETKNCQRNRTISNFT